MPITKRDVLVAKAEKLCNAQTLLSGAFAGDKTEEEEKLAKEAVKALDAWAKKVYKQL
jgi:hypothetical protein